MQNHRPNPAREIPAEFTPAQSRIQRWVAGSLALFFGAIAAVVWIFSPLSESANAWIRGSFSKLSVMLVVLVIAWPAVDRLRRIPGGPTIALFASVVLGFVALRPKAVVYILPIAVVGCIVLLSLGWTANRLK